MNTYLLNKLVRDKIPADQLQTGQNPVYHQLSAADHTAALLEKLIEEAREIPLDNPAEATKEIADVQQVLDDLIEILNLRKDDIAEAQANKRQRNGAFKEGFFVETVTVDPGSSWDEYYGNEPDRFPRA